MDLLGPCTNVFLTAYAPCKDRASVRHRPNAREKKKQLNVLDDLAEAIKALDGKKTYMQHAKL